MGSSLASRRQLDGPGPYRWDDDRPVFSPETPRPAVPGTIHVAYGRRIGGSTEGYRMVALTQHPQPRVPRGPGVAWETTRAGRGRRSGFLGVLASRGRRHEPVEDVDPGSSGCWRRVGDDTSGHEEAAPLSRRRFVSLLRTRRLSGRPCWPSQPSRRSARSASPPSPPRARPSWRRGQRFARPWRHRESRYARPWRSRGPAVARP
jgi:hypothetical protein